MSLFKRPKETESTHQTGRRRPQQRTDESPQAQAFSYYSAQRTKTVDNLGRGTDHIEPARDDNPILKRLVRSPIFLTLCAIGFAIMSLPFVLLGNEPQIKAEVRGDNAFFLQDTASYQLTVKKKLDSSWRNTNKVTVDASGIEQSLMDAYPELGRVSVTKPLLGRYLRVVIYPVKPSFILTTLESQAFLLDDSGRALVSVSQIKDSGELSVPTVDDASGVPVALGSQALPKQTVSFITSVVRLLEADSTEISNITLPRVANELHVRTDGNPYFVKFSLQDDPTQQTGTFLAAKNRLQKNKVIPKQYIDVRVPERAYYL